MSLLVTTSVGLQAAQPNLPVDGLVVLENSHDKYFDLVEQHGQRVRNFLQENKYAKQLAVQKESTVTSYFETIKKMYEELSEIDFNGRAFNKEAVGILTLNTLSVKNDLEAFMDTFGLLPDDYDNGLI